MFKASDVKELRERTGAGMLDWMPVKVIWTRLLIG